MGRSLGDTRELGEPQPRGSLERERRGAPPDRLRLCPGQLLRLNPMEPQPRAGGVVATDLLRFPTGLGTVGGKKPGAVLQGSAKLLLHRSVARLSRRERFWPVTGIKCMWPQTLCMDHNVWGPWDTGWGDKCPKCLQPQHGKGFIHRGRCFSRRCPCPELLKGLRDHNTLQGILTPAPV